MRHATKILVGDFEAADSIELTYSERFKRRIKLTTKSGEDILLDLERATELPHDAFLALDDGRFIRVVSSEENLIEVTATAKISLARLAWHIGNRHLPCEIKETSLRIADDPVIEKMLQGLGADLKHVSARFEPEKGAYGKGRIMGHQH